VTYAFMTQGLPTAKVQAIDVALAGGSEAAAADVGDANRRAMAALGQVGQLVPMRRKTKP
jgi:hypothetical protein